MSKKINLAVIFGGRSGEHEVSLASAMQVMSSLDKDKYNIIPIAITKKGNWLIGDLGQKYIDENKNEAGKEAAISMEKSQALVTVEEKDKDLTNYMEGSTGGQKIDLVLPILHGPYGEDGKLQGMLDMLDIPYVFSGCLAHALAMNKHKAKLVAIGAGLNIIPDMIIEKEEPFDIDEVVSFVAREFALPAVIKPMELGSSVGMSMAKDEKELKVGIELALKHGNSLILEEYTQGRELTVTVIGQGSHAQALPVIEIKPKVSGWFDYKAKYESGGSEEICPAEIPEETREQVQRYAVEVYNAVGCKDLARADFIWSDKDKKLYFIDLNTIPGMTATSLAPQSAEAAGMNFGEFLDKLIGYNIK